MTLNVKVYVLRTKNRLFRCNKGNVLCSGVHLFIIKHTAISNSPATRMLIVIYLLSLMLLFIVVN